LIFLAVFRHFFFSIFAQNLISGADESAPDGFAVQITDFSRLWECGMSGSEVKNRFFGLFLI
jgi:hypothetical protein